MTSNKTGDTVLVTGGAGVLGNALFERFLPDSRIIALYRSAPGAPSDRVTWIKGDTTRTDLGLGSAYNDLARGVDRVVHMAAIVDFNADRDQIWAVNRDGTRNVVRFAEQAESPLVHVSSAFVTRRATAQRVTGSNCSAGRDAYLDSKVAGEEEVAAGDVPYVVLRPSLIMGDSVTGEISRKQGLHTMIGAYVKGMVPALPLTDDTVADYLPCDVVAAAVAQAVHGDFDGGTYAVTAGRDALTVAEVLEVALRVRVAAGYDPVEVRRISLDTIQRFMWPAFISTLGDRYRLLFENMLALVSLFTDEHLHSDLGQGRFAGITPTGELGRSSVERTVERYWARKRKARV